MSSEAQVVGPAAYRPAARRSAGAIGPLCFLGMVLALCTAIFVIYAFYASKGLYGSDWQTFYQAAERWRDGRVVYTVKDGFYNPPPFLLLMRGFILLPYIPSRILWGSLSAAMLLLGARETALALGWRVDRRTGLLLSWWIVCATPTMLLCPLTGNTSAVVLLAYALSIRLFVQGREGTAGAALALTLLKPQLAICTLPLLLYKRRWRAAAAYLGVATATLLVSLPIVGLRTYGQFIEVERQIAGWTFSNDALQLDVPGIHGLFLQRWPHSHGADLAATAISAALLAALAWYWRGPWRPATARFAAGWALLIAVQLLVASYAHSYDDVLLILPALVAYWLSSRPGAPPSSVWAAPLLLALYIAPTLVLLFHQHFLVPALLALCAVLPALGAPALRKHSA